jgi:hypothetical protein
MKINEMQTWHAGCMFSLRNLKIRIRSTLTKSKGVVMNKLLACVCTGLFALSAFAWEGPATGGQMPPPPTGSLPTIGNFDSLRQAHQNMFDSIMTRNRATMDSLMASHQATIQVCRLEAEQAYKTLQEKIQTNQISPDSLKKIIEARRAEAQANLKLAIGDLKVFQDSIKAKVEKARQDLKDKIADKQKDVKGGVDVALSRLAEAQKKLEAQKAATTDKETLAKIDEAIKRLSDIQAHLQAAQQAPKN